MAEQDLDMALREDMLAKHIDIGLTLDILNRYNIGEFDHFVKIIPDGIPTVDGTAVVDIRDKSPDRLLFKFPKQRSLANLEKSGILLSRGTLLGTSALPEKKENGETCLTFTAEVLEEIGQKMLGRCAYGVLNGGSATSYADLKKNRAIDEALFSAIRPSFERFASQCRDMPKGLTPAYINPDGTPGPSFLELKMRARLLAARRLLYSARAETPFMPLFQMTSVANHGQLTRAYEDIQASSFLAPLAAGVGLKPAEWLSGVQPMIAAYTHSSEGRPKRVFDKAYGREHSALALPGGHGQSFMVLADVFRDLRDRGMRYAMLSNIDNIGAYADPVELAILAISGKPAGFDFSFKTPVDVKGGILVRTRDGLRNVVDIGPAIELQEIERLERSGAAILFNCATGIFDLDWLVPHLEEIAKNLPVRFSDQNKDAGTYSQAEQVTWEVVSLVPDFIAFAVDKKRRFLAAKMLVEMLLTSGFGIDDGTVSAQMRQTGKTLHEGQAWLLEQAYGLRCVNGRWTPRELVQC
jgi:UDP-N-acetylglucosamine pyrophosphorylase